MVGNGIEVKPVKPNLLVYRIPTPTVDIEDGKIKLKSGKKLTIIGSLFSTEELAELSEYVSKDVVEAKTGEELKLRPEGMEIPLSQMVDQIREGTVFYPKSLAELDALVGEYISASSLCGGDEEAYKELLRVINSPKDGESRDSVPETISERIPKVTVKEYATFGIYGFSRYPVFEITVDPVTDQGLAEEMKREIVERGKEYEPGPPVNMGAYQLLEEVQRLPAKVETLIMLDKMLGINLTEIFSGNVLELKESKYWRRGLFSKIPLDEL